MSNLKAKEKIMVEKLRMLSTHRFFASVMLHLKFLEASLDENGNCYIPTMGVNAFGEVTYNPQFVEKLEESDLRFVLLHELMHVILGHCYRCPDKFIKEIWNIAVDAVVNDILVNKENMKISSEVRDNIILPNEKNILKLKFGMEDSDAKSMEINIKDKPAEQIYAEIIKFLKSNKLLKNYDNTTGGNGASKDAYYRPIYKGFDNHDISEGDDLDSGCEDASSSGGKLGGKQKPNQSNSYSSAQSKRNKKLSELEKTELDRKWSSIVATANMEDPTNSRGSGNGWLERAFKMFSKPKLDWRALLRRHIKEIVPADSSYKRPKRRTYSTGVYYPIIYYKPSLITIAIDVSGSISDEYLNAFVNEIYGITRAYPNVGIRVIFWSTEVDTINDTIYKPHQIRRILSTKAKTTGGTSISCVEDYVINNDKKESSIIYMTDGFVEDKPTFKCKNKKRIFIIPNEGTDNILENFGPVAKIKI